MGGRRAGATWQGRASWLIIAVLHAVVICIPARARADAERPPLDYLSGPRAGDPLDIALDYLFGAPSDLALRRADLDEFRVVDRYQSEKSGITHIVLRQKIGGIEVWNGDIGIHISREGRVVQAHNDFVPHSANLASIPTEPLSPEQAVRSCAQQLGLTVTEPLIVLDPPQGPSRRQRLSGGGVSRLPIPMQLMYLPDESGPVRLVWNLSLRVPETGHWWSLNLDASSGEILTRFDRIEHDAYRVHPLPQGGANDGARSLVVDPADALASPFGWHDINGVPGAETTLTWGNNTSVQEDLDANDTAGFQPSGGSGLVFDFPLDLGQPPASQQSASIVNAFYWVNLLHDIHYRYGFDEAAGNFQNSNYGNGGLQGDPIFVDVQDGAATNNASFGVTSDGSIPFLELHLFNVSRLRVLSPSALAGSYASGGAVFGPGTSSPGTSGTVAQALDAVEGPGNTALDGCSPLTNAAAISGRVAFIDRGDCFFTVKVQHAQDAGASGVIIANNQGDGVFTMGGAAAGIVIPSVLIGQSDGDLIKASLSAGVSVTLEAAQQDSALDNGIVIHEYGHGCRAGSPGALPPSAACRPSRATACPRAGATSGRLR